MDIADLSRRIENIVRLGTVAEVDHPNALCRVDSGGLRTGWLPWIEHRAGQTRSWDPPSVGEQALILAPSGEAAAGIVIVGLYRTAHPAPDVSATTHVIDYPDGARISYDHASGHLEVGGIQTARIAAAVSVTLDTPLTHCTGRLTVDDLLTYGNGIAGTGGQNNNVISGDFTHADGDLSSNGIVLHTHTHGGVQPGGGSTGGPQ